jgi:hypothetical protein
MFDGSSGKLTFFWLIVSFCMMWFVILTSWQARENCDQLTKAIGHYEAVLSHVNANVRLPASAVLEPTRTQSDTIPTADAATSTIHRVSSVIDNVGESACIDARQCWRSTIVLHANQTLTSLHTFGTNPPTCAN